MDEYGVNAGSHFDHLHLHINLHLLSFPGESGCKLKRKCMSKEEVQTQFVYARHE